jgi:hypothetical protein
MSDTPVWGPVGTRNMQTAVPSWAYFSVACGCTRVSFVNPIKQQDM